MLGLLCAALLVGCMTPPEGSLGQPVGQNDVSVTVTDVSLRLLDLEGPTGGQQTDAPVLAVSLTVTNAGLEPVRYDLAWGASAATQAQTALLFVDPGPEAAPTSGTPVPRVLLNTLRFVEDPVAEAVSVGPGTSIDDILLFEAPPEGTSSLVLSLPPGVFGPASKMPAYVRIPYSPGDVQGPSAVPMGTAHAGEGFSFTVTNATVAWARLANAADETEGFSASPLLKLDFTVTNTSDGTIEYIPTAASNRFQPPVLTTAEGENVPRATFAGGIVPDGALTSRKQLGPDESYSGFMLFERPAAETTRLHLVIPGARFSSHGLVRVDVPYTHADPAEPAELTPRVIEAPQ